MPRHLQEVLLNYNLFLQFVLLPVVSGISSGKNEVNYSSCNGTMGIPGYAADSSSCTKEIPPP
jgi:hypothetical protein